MDYKNGEEAEEKLHQNKKNVHKALQDLDERAYIKQRDDEIVDALRAKFGSANQLKA